MVYIISVFMLVFYIVVRSVYPRYRYDLVMEFCWSVVFTFLLFMMLFLLIFI